VGFVGSKIVFGDGSLQHGGVVVGLQGVANHPFYKMPKEEQAKQRMLRCARDVTAVTLSGSVINDVHSIASVSWMHRTSRTSMPMLMLDVVQWRRAFVTSGHRTSL